MGTILDCSQEDGFGNYAYAAENAVVERLIFLRLSGTVDASNLPRLSVLYVHEGRAECEQLKCRGTVMLQLKDESIQCLVGFVFCVTKYDPINI